MRLYLLRHGETSWNRSHRFQGRIDIALNEFGRELAAITRRAMPPIDFDRVYCSPLSRAVETARIFLDGRYRLDDIIKDDRLTEISFGEYEGCDIREASANPGHGLYNLLWHPEAYVPTGGAESLPDIIARAGDFLTSEIMPLEGRCEHVLVVAHGALIRAVVCAAGYKEIKDFWGTQHLNCSVTTMQITGGRVTMEKEAEVFYDPTLLKEHGWSTK